MNIYLGFSFLVSLFPWVSMGIFPGDIQPYAYVLCLSSLILSLEKVFVPQLMLLFLALIGIVVAAVDSSYSFLSLRGVVSYSSPFVFFGFFLVVIERLGVTLVFRLLSVSVVLWGVGALIQMIYPEILNYFLSSRSSQGRGVTSFSPEPTFFGMHCLLLLALLTYLPVANNSRKHKAVLILLLVVFILVLAKSAMAILYLSGFLFVFVLSRLTVKNLALSLLAVGAGFVLAEQFFSNSRFYNVISGILLSDAFYTDESLNDRLRSIVFSLYGSYNNYFMPGGYHSFSNVSESYRSILDGYFWGGTDLNRIMSGLGGMFYELGAGAFIYVLFLFLVFLKKYSFERLVLLCWYLLVILSAVTFSIPILTYFVALQYYMVKETR